MDWNKRARGVVCWRPIGDYMQPMTACKGKEGGLDLERIEAAVGNTRDVLEYIQASPGGCWTNVRHITLDQRARASLPPHYTELSSTPHQTPKSLASSLNHDVLVTIFTLLASSPLQFPPFFQRGANNAGGPFLAISKRGDSDVYASGNPRKYGDEVQDTLNACVLVSKAWYQAAGKLLWYTAVLRLEHLESELTRWGGEEENRENSRLEETSDRTNPAWRHSVHPWPAVRRKAWVQRMILIGGGMKPPTELPLHLRRIWHLFPSIQHVEIFGLGWGTEGLLDIEKPLYPQALPSLPLTIPDSFSRIRSLDITATPEYLLRGMPTGQNFLDTVKLLRRLPVLKSLSLRSFTYRHSAISAAAPTSHLALVSIADRNSPHSHVNPVTYTLDTLVLDKCSLSLAAMQWIIGWRSCVTLRLMEVEGCSFWDDEDVDGAWFTADDGSGTELKGMFEAMVDRLSVDLPVFRMSER